MHGIDTSAGGGYGVDGTSTNGVGVSAGSTSGTALKVAGVASFSRSGVAVVAGTTGAPATSVTVTGIAFSSASLVLATPQAYVAGVGVAAAVPNPGASSFTIYLTAPVTLSLGVAYFVAG